MLLHLCDRVERRTGAHATHKQYLFEAKSCGGPTRRHPHSGAQQTTDGPEFRGNDAVQTTLGGEGGA